MPSLEQIQDWINERRRLLEIARAYKEGEEGARPLTLEEVTIILADIGE